MSPGFHTIEMCILCIFHRHVSLLELPTHFVSKIFHQSGKTIIIPTDVISDFFAMLRLITRAVVRGNSLDTTAAGCYPTRYKIFTRGSICMTLNNQQMFGVLLTSQVMLDMICQNTSVLITSTNQYNVIAVNALKSGSSGVGGLFVVPFNQMCFYLQDFYGFL